MTAQDLARLSPIDRDEIEAGDSVNLSEKQERFVSAITAGNNLTDAARLAGYSMPETQGWRLSQLPHIQRACRARIAAQLNTQGAQVGFSTLIEIATDKTAPKGARVQASNSLLDRAGFVSKVLEKQRDSENKPLTEMSAAELEAFISGGMQKLERLRKGGDVVDGEFVEAQNQAETPDNAQSPDDLSE